MKKLTIFLDCGDTIIDEGTEVFDERGIVQKACVIPGADKMVRTLYERGYRLILVADGYAESFRNTLTQNGVYDCFSSLIISEQIRAEKPSPKMFLAALGAAELSAGDVGRVIMVGNNLARDVKGANAQRITSVFLDWTPRYSKDPADPSEEPDYIIHEPMELVELAERLENELK